MRLEGQNKRDEMPGRQRRTGAGVVTCDHERHKLRNRKKHQNKITLQKED